LLLQRKHRGCRRIEYAKSSAIVSGRSSSSSRQDQHCSAGLAGYRNQFLITPRTLTGACNSGSSTLASVASFGKLRVFTPPAGTAVDCEELPPEATMRTMQAGIDSEDDEGRTVQCWDAEDDKFYSSNGQTAQSAMLLSQLQPSHRATSLDAGINNCFV
uniref:WD_REPEATS_REGION domain-containing protein n=1 Tax=Macrostomum lignano TaxID=282301 RepID=A0A1I8FE83_9PLAT